ncbi:efflux pump antibiotic resistance [Fusarium beomiforme]|uniref:Efflux pump antibiotic resistance n=1 Tax=Fusarium beomiforme TaxID=44412 RepID=A0A9P5AGN0_9HYPO|nr:efflux pump antibiotic resistance [Fusarium beomiforme]
MASAKTNDDNSSDGLKIIHAGLYRTGTASMAEAYRILGYKAHHALHNEWHEPWDKLEQAAEAAYPHLRHLPDYTHNGLRPSFTRGDWQCLWGEYDVATDIASTFVLELIKAYPEAKVVIVQRDFEHWWPSFRSEVLVSVFNATWLQKFLAWHLLRFRALHAMRKILAGFLSMNSYSLEEVTAEHARYVYERFYSQIREAVPEERRLEYSLGDGWEPLCRFLGKNIPNGEFPRMNDRNSHSKDMERLMEKLVSVSLRVVGPWLAGVLAIAFLLLTW